MVGIYTPAGPRPSTPLPDTSSEEAASGLAVAQGLAQIGQAGEHVGQIERQIKVADEFAHYGAGAAEARERIDTSKVQLAQQYGQGSADYVAGVNDLIDTEGRNLQQGLTTRQAQLRAMEHWRSYAAGERGDLAAQSAVAGAKARNSARDVQIDIATNRATRADDEGKVDDEIAELRTTIAAEPAPPEVKAAAERELIAHVKAGYVQGQSERNPAAIIARIDKGDFDAAIPPGQLKVLRDNAEVELRRQETAARAAAGLAKSQLADQRATIKARLAAGEQVPDAELAAAQAGAAGVGDQSAAYELGVARETARVNRESEPWQPIQYREEIDRLTAKGAQRSPADDRRMKQLQTIEPERTRAFNDDPGPWAALNGHPRPSFDPADPRSAAAIGEWARTVQRATGVLPAPLAKDQAAQMHAIATTGTAQERAALAGSMLGLGSLAGKARDQIGGDANFNAALALGGRPESSALIAMALEGATAQDKTLLQPAKDEAGQPLTPGADEVLRRDLGGAFALMPGDYVTDTRRNIMNLYFYQAKRQGLKAFDPQVMQDATRQVLGGKLAWWGGDRVALPAGMPAVSFERRVGAATRENWQSAAAGGKMPWTSGGEMGPAEMRGYVPTKRADGAYRLRKGNSYAINRDGSFFEFDPGRLWDGPRISAQPDAPPSSFELRPFAH